MKHLNNRVLYFPLSSEEESWIKNWILLYIREFISISIVIQAQHDFQRHSSVLRLHFRISSSRCFKVFATEMFCSTINHIFFVSLLASCQPIEIYNRLQNLITYVKNHKESQNPNLMLGLYICEGKVIIYFIKCSCREIFEIISIENSAQLLTIKSDPLDIYRPPMELLEDIKNLREQYEREAHRKPIWQSYTYSSIGELCSSTHSYSYSYSNRWMNECILWVSELFPRQSSGACSCSAVIEFKFLGQIVRN